MDRVEDCISLEKVIDILKTIYGITIQLPQSKEKKLMLLDKTKEQKLLLKMFDDFWVSY